MSWKSLKEIPPFSFSLYFPRLTSQYVETSVETDAYNCVAWAIGITDVQFDSLYGAWPEELEKGNRQEVYAKFYELHGFVDCTPDHSLEVNFEKIALFAEDGIFLHVARQLNNGNWTSKMGDYEDIEHTTLDAVGGGDYGKPEIIMKRSR